MKRDWRPTSFVETSPGLLTEEEATTGAVEQRKAVYDFLKHFMTLSSGALVLVATLIEKVFPQPIHRELVAMAMAGLAVSLVAGGLTYFILLAHYPRVGAVRMTSSDRRWYLASMAVMLTGFLTGMGSLVWFFVVNWLR